MMANDFSSCAPYYDVIQNVKEFERYAEFAARVLKKYDVKTVLELGCGTGLYLFPLQKHVDIEGLDISKEMLDLAKKKGPAKLYKADMSSFRVGKKFDAIMCMNTSLLYLPNMKSIVNTIKNVAAHLKPKGIFLLDIPNLDVEIKELNGHQVNEHFELPDGELDVIFRDYVENNRWTGEWNGFAKHGKKYIKFHEKYSEFIYDVEELERELKKRFTILTIYGSRSGAVFNPNKSYRRFYVCQLAE